MQCYRCLVCALTMAIALTFADQARAQGGGNPTVTSAAANYVTGTLTIQGTNFGNQTPTVSLGAASLNVVLRLSLFTA